MITLKKKKKYFAEIQMCSNLEMDTDLNVGYYKLGIQRDRIWSSY